MTKEEKNPKESNANESGAKKPEVMDEKNPGSVGNDERTGIPGGNPFGDSVDNEDDENALPAEEDDDERRAIDKMAGKLVVEMEKENEENVEKGESVGKASEVPRRMPKTARKERTIPGKDVLAVRYVKMRDNKMADAREFEPANGGAAIERSGGEISDEQLEGILGVKAERKEGERWVKLSEVDFEQSEVSEKNINSRQNEKQENKEQNETKNKEEIKKDNKEDNKEENKEENEEENKKENTERNKEFADPEENASACITKNSSANEEKSLTKKSGSENVVSRLERTRDMVRKDCITLARGIRARRKEKSAAFKCSLERRVESVEKLIEDRMENMLEETVEKHPWLQPIENWYDKYKSARTPTSPKTTVDGGHFPVVPKRLTMDVDDVEEIGEENGEERIFIETVKKSDCEETMKSESSSSTGSSKESSPELSKLRGEREDDKDGKEETTTPAGKMEKVERSRNIDLFDKLRDGFREKVEDVQRYFQRTSRLADVNRKLKSQIWSSVVTIVLVEAKNLLPMDIDGLSDPYVKFRLGTEKYKSKVVNKTLSPVWLEQFDLHLYEDPYLGQELEVTVWDRDKGHQDDLMGRTTINLASMERETTHRLWRDLEDGAGQIYLLLTISGTTASETISDLAAHEETPQERSRLLERYSLRNSLQRPRDVGHLTVKVYRAQGLAAADLGGKSDPFCVLELVNARLQTQTEYKTLAPNWQKIFTFNVKDINSVLEVTVYDEDRDHKVEFLGRVAIPLLRVRNAEKRWYALKDKKLRGRAKGNSPQIMLEMIVVWNIIRACARTLNPKEKKYMEPEVKFKRQVFLRNVLRLKSIIVFFIDMGKYIQSCWEWESKTRSIVALVLFVLLCYYFEPWMIPTAALLILMKYCMVAMLTGGSSTGSYYRSPSVGQLHDSGDGASDDGPLTPGDDDDDEDDKDKEEKKSLKERLQAIQEVTQTVQNSIGYIASLCERIKNLFNFTVPYLSYLAMILFVIGVVVLYFIPMRYLILAWGVNKFLRKLLRPHSVPNNEVLDLISRVPDDEDLLNYRELKSMPTADCEKAGTSSTSSGATPASRRDHRKKHKPA